VTGGIDAPNGFHRSGTVVAQPIANVEETQGRLLRLLDQIGCLDKFEKRLGFGSQAAMKRLTKFLGKEGEGTVTGGLGQPICPSRNRAIVHALTSWALILVKEL
jgi:hypothetical protein